MPPNPDRVRVYWLPNPGDGPAAAAEFDTARAQAAGILLVRLSPLAATEAQLAVDVLAALGVYTDTPGPSCQHHPAQELLSLVQAHLCGLRITHLIIERGDRLTPAQRHRAAAWCAHLQASLWLIAPRRPAETRQGPVEVLRESLHRAVAPRPARWSGQWDYLHLPTVEFPAFRAACHRLLAGDEAALVDEAYRGAYQRVADRLRRAGAWRLRPLHTAPPMTAGGIADEQVRRRVLAVSVMHEALTADDPPAPARLVRLRASQAALFTRLATLVTWQPPVTDRAAGFYLPGSLVTSAHAARIRQLADPSAAAANLLAGLLEQDASRLVELSRSAVSLNPGHATVTIGGIGVRVPAWATPVLRAHHCRAVHQAPRKPDLPTGFFARRGAQVSATLLGYDIDALGRLIPTETGDFHPDDAAPLPTAALGRPAATRFPRSWLARRHLAIHPLDADLLGPSSPASTGASAR
jgi:hypothetical protein